MKTWYPLKEKSSTVALRPQHLQTLLNAAGTVKLECEGKGRTHAEFTLKFDVSIKLRNNLISDHKAQSDTLSVHLLSVLDESEQFEKLVLVTFRYAYSSILYRDFNFLLVSKQIRFINADMDHNFAAPCELQSIRL